MDVTSSSHQLKLMYSRPIEDQWLGIWLPEQLITRLTLLTDMNSRSCRHRAYMGCDLVGYEEAVDHFYGSVQDERIKRSTMAEVDGRVLEQLLLRRRLAHHHHVWRHPHVHLLVELLVHLSNFFLLLIIKQS